MLPWMDGRMDGQMNGWMRSWQLAREKAFNTKTSNAKIYVSGAESMVDTHRCPSAQERERPISNRKAKIEEEEKKQANRNREM